MVMYYRTEDKDVYTTAARDIHRRSPELYCKLVRQLNLKDPLQATIKVVPREDLTKMLNLNAKFQHLTWAELIALNGACADLSMFEPPRFNS